MYRVMVKQGSDWVEEGSHTSFGVAWDFARTLRLQGKEVKIVGPEGEWLVKGWTKRPGGFYKEKGIGDARKGPDFTFDGSWIVETAQGPKTIFNNPDNRWWYDADDTRLPLSTGNKQEAIKRLLAKYPG